MFIVLNSQEIVEDSFTTHFKWKNTHSCKQQNKRLAAIYTISKPKCDQLTVKGNGVLYTYICINYRLIATTYTQRCIARALHSLGILYKGEWLNKIIVLLLKSFILLSIWLLGKGDKKIFCFYISLLVLKLELQLQGPKMSFVKGGIMQTFLWCGSNINIPIPLLIGSPDLQRGPGVSACHKTLCVGNCVWRCELWRYKFMWIPSSGHTPHSSNHWCVLNLEKAHISFFPFLIGELMKPKVCSHVFEFVDQRKILGCLSPLFGCYLHI